jgi:hypothetical protein
MVVTAGGGRQVGIEKGQHAKAIANVWFMQCQRRKDNSDKNGNLTSPLILTVTIENRGAGDYSEAKRSRLSAQRGGSQQTEGGRLVGP